MHGMLLQWYCMPYPQHMLCFLICSSAGLWFMHRGPHTLLVWEEFIMWSGKKQGLYHMPDPLLVVCPWGAQHYMFIDMLVAWSGHVARAVCCSMLPACCMVCAISHACMLCLTWVDMEHGPARMKQAWPERIMRCMTRLHATLCANQEAKSYTHNVMQCMIALAEEHEFLRLVQSLFDGGTS